MFILSYMNTKIDFTIIAFLLTIGITTISSQSIFAKLLNSSVNNINIINNGINNILIVNTTIDISNISNNSNSSEMCKMPDCPKDQICVQVCPESVPPL